MIDLDELLTTIAIHLKGIFGAVLGLGVTFAAARTVIGGLFTLPSIDRSRPSTRQKADGSIRELRWMAALTVLLLAAAIALYLASPLASVDVDALKAGAATLNPGQKRAIMALLLTSAAVVAIEFRALALRNRINELPKKH
ncbi:MAG TPA: hypothetical protein VF535_02690 [Allosphingosinicella sp.]